jgi:transposase
VRQRTMLRNRIHRLLGAQHEVKLPECSDLFGCKGLNFLEKLELPAPARLLLSQQLALLKELAVRIHEDEQALKGLLQETPALNYVRSLPGMGPILAAVVVSEIDGIERFPSAQKLCGYAGLCPSTTAAGARLFKANCYNIATNGSAGPSSRPLGWPSVARPTSGTSTNASERLARSPASPSWPPRV